MLWVEDTKKMISSPNWEMWICKAWPRKLTKGEVRKQAKEYETKNLEVEKKLPIDVLYSKGKIAS